MEIKNYYVAKDLDDALQKFMLSSDNHLLGGGAWMKNSLRHIDTAIELSHLVSNDITETKEFIEIGAMCTLHDLSIHPAIIKYYDGILAQASKQIMGITVRNIATIGGTIAGKYAFSDLLTPLLAMNCQLMFYRQGIITIEEYLQSAIREKDILLKVLIKKSTAKGYFHKVAKTALDFSIVNVAVVKDNQNFSVCVGARPQIAAKAFKACELLNSSGVINQEIIEKAAKMAADELTFSSNFRGQAEYRKMVTETYIKRGLQEVITNAR